MTEITSVDYGLSTYIHYLPLIYGLWGSILNLAIYYFSYLFFNIFITNYNSFYFVENKYVLYGLLKMLNYYEYFCFVASQKWYFDYFYNKTLAQTCIVFFKFVSVSVDRGFLDFVLLQTFLHQFKTVYSTLFNTFFLSGFLQLYFVLSLSVSSFLFIVSYIPLFETYSLLLSLKI